MAGNNSSSGVTTEQVKLILTVVSTFGLGSILVVVIGRLWTIAYFDYFGLSTGDLEFSVDDFAFRSLEVWVSLGLAGLGLFLAVRAKEIFQRAKSLVLLVEIIFAGAGSYVVLRGPLDHIVGRWPWLADTGRLGVISGVVLFLMIFVVADFWFGSPKPRTGTQPQPAGRNFIGRVIGNWKEIVAGLLAVEQEPPEGQVQEQPQGQAEAQPQGQTQKQPQAGKVGAQLTRNWNKVLAGVLAMAIVFIYLPLVSDTLANIQAKVDLKEGRLPVAILETVEDPLPDAIASDAEPTKSNLVRVVLAQGKNTYVLHSTQCKTIGEPEVEVEETEDQVTISRDIDVCKVFAIPTGRLKSIEYRSVTGNPPPNDTPFLAAQVGLRQPFEPFEATVSTRGAGDDEHIHCQDQEPGSFRHTVWYEVMPTNEGALLVRADSLTEGLSPVIGVWPGSEEAVLEQDAASGSGPRRRACETVTVEMPRERQRALAAPDKARRVATIANLQAERTYFVGIGANGDAQGDIHVFIEFFPNGSFLAPNDEPMPPDLDLPSVELPSTLGRVQLEFRRFDTAEYTLTRLEACEPRTAELWVIGRLAPSAGGICISTGADGARKLRVGGEEGAPVRFSLKSDEGVEVAFTLVHDDDRDLERTTLEAQGILAPGTWQLTTPGPLRGLASLVIPTLQPNLILAFDGAREAQCDDVSIQEALLLALDPAQIRDELQLEGPVVVDQASFCRSALTREERNLLLYSGEVLIGQLALLNGLPVQVEGVEQGQQTGEEKEILRRAADVVQSQLEDLHVRATEGCVDVCIRIFFIRPQPDVPAQSEVLGEALQPEGPEPEQ